MINLDYDSRQEDCDKQKQSKQRWKPEGNH